MNDRMLAYSSLFINTSMPKSREPIKIRDQSYEHFNTNLEIKHISIQSTPLSSSSRTQLPPLYPTLPSSPFLPPLCPSLMLDYNKTLIMASQVAYLQMQNQYPFLQVRQWSESGSLLQIKKTILYDCEPRFIIKEKVRMLKSLGYQNLVGLQSSKSDEHAIILYFQYVPFQLINEIPNISEEKINSILAGMLELCDGLAARSIVHELDVRRVGLDKRYNLKYYLGVDFRIDKSVDKGVTQEGYRKLVTTFFGKVSKGEGKGEGGMGRMSRGFQPNSPKNEERKGNDAKNILKVDSNPKRKILKKSSILESECKEQGTRALKNSSRFTFNNDNHIHIAIDEQPEFAEDAPHSPQPLKIQELTARINRLKGFMKEITVKTGSKAAKQEESQPSKPQGEKYRFLSPTFAKFQKRITQLRESKLAIAAKIQQAINKKHANADTPKKQPSPKAESVASNSESKQFQAKTTQCHPSSPPESLIKLPSFSGDDNRQHKEYFMLANKDKYCEQFMHFLEDNQSLQTSLNSKKPTDPFTPPPEQQPKKGLQLKQNLKTQSSENALQIQNRVQKVIRSSLRLINGLRSRQIAH